MGFINQLGSRLGLTEKSNPSNEISQIIPISGEPSRCDRSECLNAFRSNCFKLNSEDEATTLWESAKPFDFHILVSTGNHDWKHDAFDLPGTVLESINDFDYQRYGTVKLNVTSMAMPCTESQYKKLQKADVLIMPYFVWVRGITTANCDKALVEVLDILAAKHGSFKDLPKEIEGATLEADIFKSRVFLCSHRTRDKRCGKTAPIMKKEFDAQLRDMGYYRDIGDNRPNGVSVDFVNHVGGHKFAANVLIYNKGGEFAWFARCTPLNVRPIINETILKGKVFPQITRTAKKYHAVNW
ncbi:hypothetical protein FOA43_001125 [Brettanomyces nanus]|uniref:Uncharacterized protein n=1 Tax=Eeniella nana TaxID=13502 RepID=A0A875RWT9_EENNA|nr:uncharacterized protein FOA43_001125 [Brettanomyces nanus]QPG73811.1 hypothetical protein FOA43_001125 [Brettanomyces nanus]